ASVRASGRRTARSGLLARVGCCRTAGPAGPRTSTRSWTRTTSSGGQRIGAWTASPRPTRRGSSPAKPRRKEGPPKKRLLFLAALGGVLILPSEPQAFGPHGGGGGRGGGGARPAPHPTPAMSRPSPQHAARPAPQQISRPSVGPSASRPANFQRPAPAARPSPTSFCRPSAPNAPTVSRPANVPSARPSPAANRPAQLAPGLTPPSLPTP